MTRLERHVLSLDLLLVAVRLRLYNINNRAREHELVASAKDALVQPYQILVFLKVITNHCHILLLFHTG